DPLPPGARARLGTTRLHGRAALSPDGKVLALVRERGPWPGRRGRGIVLCDPATGRRLQTFEGAFEGAPLLLDGGPPLLAGSLPSPTLRAWDTRTGKPLGQVLRPQLALAGRTCGIPDGGVSADGQRFVVEYEGGGRPRVVIVWQREPLKRLRQVELAHTRGN